MTNIKQEYDAVVQETGTAFRTAIEQGRLSDNPNDDNYSGSYMYMGKSRNGQKDAFKNICTREYVA